MATRKRKEVKRKAVKGKDVKAKAVWCRPAPKKAKHTHLSAAQKKSAKAAAKRAGRPYPNLVDNIHAVKKAT